MATSSSSSRALLICLALIALSSSISSPSGPSSPLFAEAAADALAGAGRRDLSSCSVECIADCREENECEDKSDTDERKACKKMCRKACKKECRNDDGGGGGGGGDNGGRRVVDRVDSEASCSDRDEKDSESSVLLAVTNRELYIGCHSWEEYFSPKFRTVIIVNEAVADEWNLGSLVKRVPCSKSLGATLLKLGNFGGELQGRQLALDLLEKEHPRTQFLMQLNCDVHAIPKWHDYYRPLRESVLKSAEDLHLVRAQREPKKYEVENKGSKQVPKFKLVDNAKQKDDPCYDNPILGMSFILVEDFKDDEDLVTRYHGVDGCKWQVTGGPDARPDSKFGDYPWLCSGDRWENHALIFDVAKLQSVRNDYLDGPVALGAVTYPSDTKFGPRFAEEYKMCMVTHRDVHYHIDFALEKPLTGEDTLDKYDSRVDKDTIRVLSLASLGETRDPINPYRLFQAYEDIGLVPYIGGTGPKFYERHAESSKSPWMPRDIEDKSLNDPLAETLLDGTMKLFGYERFNDDGCDSGELCYRIHGVYPGVNYVYATTSSRRCDDCWEFMEIGSKKRDTIYLTAVADVTMKKIRAMDPSDRIIKLSAGESYIRRFSGPSEIEGRDTICNKGHYRPGGSNVCGAPDQNVKKACGYKDSDRFDTPY